MLNKKIIFMAIILVSLLAVSAVSATDNATEDIIDVDTTDELSIVENQQLEQKDNDENVSVENDLEILSEDTGTFSGLTDEIQNGGNIELKHKYYKYDSGDAIVITVNNSVIDGKGAVIDMAGSWKSAFNVLASDVIIKNLSFKNFNLTKMEDYYIIACGYKGSCNLENCNFINNFAVMGLIHSSYTLTNCNFINNSVMWYGIIGNSNSVTNCNFTNNTVMEHGIFLERLDTVTNCNFINNSVEWKIFSSDTVTNCNFINNNNSGRESIVNSNYVTNCNFTNNIAKEGGAVSLIKGTVTYCNFINNSATSGGAIYLNIAEDGYIEIVNCNFINNSATSGGAIYFIGSADITKYKFIKNYLNDGEVKNCNFTDNTAPNGSAIYVNSSSVTVSNSKFESKFTNNWDDVIYEATYVNCTLNGNLSKTETESNVTVIDNSKIDASNVKVTYLVGSYYTIKVYGTDGQLADGVDVIITVKGKTFKTLTTKNGVAKFKVSNAPGTYKMNITALGKSVIKTLTVKHLVTLKAVSVKKSAKKLVLKATLGKINKKYLKNKKITFKFNGKKYTAKTNKKGVAKLTIKSSVLKKLKVGKKVTYQATYVKDTVKKTVKIKK